MPIYQCNHHRLAVQQTIYHHHTACFLQRDKKGYQGSQETTAPASGHSDFSAADAAAAIRGYSNSKAFGPDSLTIFHLKHLGPLALNFLAALYNDSITNSYLPSIWKMSTVIPLPKPGKDSSQGKSFHPISLLCPAAEVLEALILPSLNNHLQLADHQYGFRASRSTTSALLRLTTDIAEGFNEKKPPSRTMAVVVNLSAAFDTVNHNKLINKVNNSTLPIPLKCWLSCYL